MAFVVTVNSQKRLYALPGVEIADLTLSGGTGTNNFFITRVPKPLHVAITILKSSAPSAETFAWSGGTGTASQPGYTNEVAKRIIYIFSTLQSSTTSRVIIKVTGYPA